ncbi:hypothetical protein Y032_0097g2977 [Ancylostoma ceylanicum]|uniref:Uncharacterized protein n=1 Tax=Ancylostoma ceylanicum TaxID=53326 RepID=A0A016TIP0_9BILA|nr:hypothetical protein Y032_0097g2977 [Ancylostoma ceylanicum]
METIEQLMSFTRRNHTYNNIGFRKKSPITTAQKECNIGCVIRGSYCSFLISQRKNSWLSQQETSWLLSDESNNTYI